MNSNEIHSVLSKALLSKEGPGHQFRGNQYTGGIMGNGSKVETAANWNKKRAARGLKELKAFPLTPAQIKSAKQGRKTVTPETVAGYKKRLANAKLNRAKSGSGLTGKVSVHHGATDTTSGGRDTPRYSAKQLLNVLRTGEYGPAKGATGSGLTGKVKVKSGYPYGWTLNPQFSRLSTQPGPRPTDKFLATALANTAGIGSGVLGSAGKHLQAVEARALKPGDTWTDTSVLGKTVTKVRAVQVRGNEVHLLVDHFSPDPSDDFSEEYSDYLGNDYFVLRAPRRSRGKIAARYSPPKAPRA